MTGLDIHIYQNINIFFIFLREKQVSSSTGTGSTVIDAQGDLKALQRDTVIWMSSASRSVPQTTSVISETTISFPTTATILPIVFLRSSVQGLPAPLGAMAANNLFDDSYTIHYVYLRFLCRIYYVDH